MNRDIPVKIIFKTSIVHIQFLLLRTQKVSESDCPRCQVSIITPLYHNA